MSYINIFTDGAVPNNQFQGNRKGGIGVFFCANQIKFDQQGKAGASFNSVKSLMIPKEPGAHQENDPRNLSYSIIETKDNKVTNQVCELLACISALETVMTTQIIGKNEIIIYTDSMYVINSITLWAKNWRKNNWRRLDNKPIQNLELIKKLYYLSKNLKVGYKHVKAHTSPPDEDSDEYFEWYGNYMADKLAVQGSLKNN
jgi:ribonuclease HI